MSVIFFVGRDGTVWPVKRIAGGKGGGGGTPVITQAASNTSPWSEQQPFLKQGFEQAEQQFKGPKPEYYPGSTVVPFSPETETALGLKTGMAVDPNSLISLAGRETGNTLRGDYVNADNPVYRNLLKGVSDIVIPQTATQFAKAGRGTGSPGYAEALGRGIATGMTPYLGAERGRMFDATQTAFPVSQQAPSLLASVGAARELQGRDLLQEDIERFNFAQNIEAKKLAQYMQNITGAYGGTTLSQSSQPTFSNPLMTGLGAGASAVGIGQGLFGKPGGGGLFK